MSSDFFQKETVRGATLTLFIALLLLSSTPARAELSVHLPQDCGPSAEFEHSLEQWVTAADGSELELQVSVVVSSDGAYLLTLLAPHWSRSVEDPQCEVVLEAALVIVAAWLEEKASAPDAPASPPSADSDEQPLASSPPPTPKERAKDRLPETERRREEAPQSPRASSKGAKIAAFLSAAGSAEWGMAPGVRPSALLGGGLEWRKLGLQAEARWLPPANAQRAGGRELRLGAAGARLGASWAPLAPLRLVLGISVMRYTASSRLVREPGADQVWLTSAELELQARPWQSGHFGFEIAAKARLGFTQPRFEVAPARLLYEMPRVGGGGIFRGMWFF